MDTKFPVQLLKPTFLREIPRSEYLPGPKLKSHDESSRRSFISLLRKGPNNTKHMTDSQSPVSITLSCAIWLRFSDAINNTVSLFLHYKDKKEEYCILVDEANLNNSTSIMLSGKITIYPASRIEFIKTCCAGVSKRNTIYIDDMHISGNILLTRDELEHVS